MDFLTFLNLLLQVFTYRSDARTRAGSVHSPNIRRRTEYGFCSALIAQGRLLFFLVPFPTLGTNSTTWKLKKFLDYWLNISSTERRRRYNSAPRNVTESLRIFLRRSQIWNWKSLMSVFSCVLLFVGIIKILITYQCLYWFVWLHALGDIISSINKKRFAWLMND